MNLKILKNDFKRNRAGNTALLLFIALAAGLVAAAAIVIVQLVSSITGMYETAKPPHFLYMHKGELNQTEIDQFNENYEGVTSWQTVGMINLFGEELVIEGEESFDLSDCILDISMVKQNVQYDLLLDNRRNTIELKPGEIAMPVILLDSYNINLGDRVIMTSNGIKKDFVVTEFVHDAQMNSTMCSSTRILISDQDFEELFGKAGEVEYIIETYFTDTALAADYQTAYENAGLPQNGQGITYTILFLLSALTDIMMALIFILVSVLLIFIALMCMKFTVMASMEEEIGEIGTMKAIGMSYKDIRYMYLGKINILVFAGIILGYILANIFANTVTAHISETFGRAPVTVLTVFIPLAASAVVFLLANLYCRWIIRKLKKITVVDALVTGKGFGRGERVKDGLHRAEKTEINLLLSMRQTIRNFRAFSIIFLVMCIVSAIMIIPVNLVHTMEDRKFASYMGSPVSDIIIEVETGEQSESRYETIVPVLRQDADIDNYQELRRVRLATQNADRETMNLHIDTGSQSGQGLKYLSGRAPANDGEIALSRLNADAAAKSTGDTITVTTGEKDYTFTISGIYQDATGGGYSAKAIYSFAGVDAESFSFTINLISGVNAEEKAAKWSAELGGGYTIKPMEEFINQTLGGVVRQLNVAVKAVILIGFILTALIVVMFMKLRLSRDVSQIAAMKAIGFSSRDIKKQYLYKICFTALIGISAGTILAGLIGDNIVSAAFGMLNLGISNVAFIINPWMTYIILPVFLLFLTAGMTWMSAGQIRKYNIVSLINE